MVINIIYRARRQNDPTGGKKFSRVTFSEQKHCLKIADR